MARAHLREQLVSDKTGALIPISGATVNVYEQGTTTQVTATMYDAESAGNALTNPLTSDANGVVEFWMASPQLVELAISASGYTSQTIEAAVIGLVSGTTGVQNVTTTTAIAAPGDVRVNGEDWTWEGATGAHTAVNLDKDQTITGHKTLTPTLAAGAPTAAGQVGYASSKMNFGDGAASHNVVSEDQTQTLTNKTLTAPTLGGTTTATTISAPAATDLHLNVPTGQTLALQVNSATKLSIVDGGVSANSGVGNAVTALTPGATVSVDPTVGDVFTLTPGQGETINMASVKTGQRLTLIITTSGTISFTLTFGTSFKTTGTLATGTVSGKVFVMNFVSDGTNYNEVSRTVAM